LWRSHKTGGFNGPANGRASPTALRLRQAEEQKIKSDRCHSWQKPPEKVIVRLGNTSNIRLALTNVRAADNMTEGDSRIYGRTTIFGEKIGAKLAQRPFAPSQTPFRL